MGMKKASHLAHFRCFRRHLPPTRTDCFSSQFERLTFPHQQTILAPYWGTIPMNLILLSRFHAMGTILGGSNPTRMACTPSSFFLLTSFHAWQMTLFFIYYYNDRWRIYLNLFKWSQSAAGVKALKPAANGHYLTCKLLPYYLLYRSTFILLSVMCMLGLFVFQ